MQLETFTYNSVSGWSRAFPELDSKQTLVVVFGGACFADDPGPLQALQQAYPLAHHIGCSTSGEIYDTVISDDSLSVAVMQLERSSMQSAIAHVAEADESYAAGRNIAEQLAADGLQGVFVISDGLLVNGSQLVRGLNDVLPAGTTVTGGLAGDGARFAQTWSLLHGMPTTGIVAAIGFYGDNIRIGHGSKGGWDLFGLERRVTRSDGNVLYEIDGRPALELYKEYLGDRASELPATGLLFPLALREHADSQKQIVRTILGVDEEHQSMTFAGDIPEGSLVQLMRANFDRLVAGASDAASVTGHEDSSQGCMLSIAISCVGRRLVLGERTEEEVEAVMDILPAGTKQVGFYSYGEISPYASGSCDLHNQTMTLTTIREI